MAKPDQIISNWTMVWCVFWMSLKGPCSRVALLVEPYAGGAYERKGVPLKRTAGPWSLLFPCFLIMRWVVLLCHVPLPVALPQAQHHGTNWSFRTSQTVSWNKPFFFISLLFQVFYNGYRKRTNTYQTSISDWKMFNHVQLTTWMALMSTLHTPNNSIFHILL